MTEIKKKDSELNVNSNEDWGAIRANWLKQRSEKAAAYADKYFMTDDELPLRKHVILVTTFLFFFVIVVWASFAEINETARGEGQVIPAGEVQIIQNLEGGIVESFLYKEGDVVQKDEVIMRLKDVGATSDLGSNEARYLGLLASITRLQAEVDGKDAVEFPDEVMKKAPQSVTEELNAFRTNKDKIEGQIAVLEQQLSQRKQEVSELSTRSHDLQAVINLSRQEKNMIEPLVAKGSAPRIELIQLERGIKEKQTELNGVYQAIPRAKSAIAEAEARITEMKNTAIADAQTDLAMKTIEMNTVQKTLGALEDKKDRTEIRSPVKGTIKDFKINTVGGVVRPGDPIVEIVPVDDNLLVEVKIKPSDIARLRPDMAAMVKITAYDFTVYGGLKGKVIDISPDTIKNDKGESFYRVLVRTDSNSLYRDGKPLPIIPGMISTVDIVTGHKTIMEYLMKPFFKTVQNSLNEK
ncbi:MAG: HlyD family type I secretion periplasmic adaptor subunit [Alphaproteobacteria bacterium]|jgi:adhesin transport system membrane fusion protein|nr:HlyD family type I secretion periplasmic adaptor subunit [Alphaproteobacteria bacterium]HPQ50809.1 HlyD family type I secretion periplasmic adaptor subunit [Alphaproteobacteria bacterium]